MSINHLVVRAGADRPVSIHRVYAYCLGEAGDYRVGIKKFAFCELGRAGGAVRVGFIKYFGWMM
jgi:hypothetical protein